MIKVGILTFHNALNYGAVLQAYALQKTIEKLGYRCEIIDYTTKTHRNALRKATDEIQKLPENNRERKERFEAFIQKEMRLSNDKYFTERDFQQGDLQYDVYVVGSDQIWNPEFIKSGVSSKIFFLYLDKFENRIAYAPSIGIASKKKLQPYLKYIDKFDYVCTRENETAKYLSMCLNKKIEKAEDPVFLLDRRAWKKLAHKKYTGKPYLLLYIVREDNFSLKIAKKIANLLKLKIIVINYIREYVGNGVYNCLNAGPIDFLNFIRNATVVCTSSFHATAFSIIFNVPFFTFEQIANDYRILDLLKNFSLEERLLGENRKIPELNVMLKRPDVSDEK